MQESEHLIPVLYIEVGKMDLFDINEAEKESNNKLRIKELEKLITRYQKSYYNGEGEIEDSEFDKLWDELKTLDAVAYIRFASVYSSFEDLQDFAKAIAGLTNAEKPEGETK